jgi:6-phosphogluconate dehydrogenase
MTTTIAFLGLGAMGAPMAHNLMAAGFALRVWNRSAARTQPFAARGATVCASPAEAVRGASFVVSMVGDDDATREVMLGADGAVAAAAPEFDSRMDNLIAALPSGEWLIKPVQCEHLGRGKWRVSKEWQWAEAWSIVFGGTLNGT